MSLLIETDESKERKMKNRERLYAWLKIPENREKYNAYRRDKYKELKDDQYKIVLQHTGLKFKKLKDLKEYTIKIVLQNLDRIITVDDPNFNLFLDLFLRNPECDRRNPTEFIFISKRYKSPNMKSSQLTRDETYRPHYRVNDEDEWVSFSLNRCFILNRPADGTIRNRNILSAMRREINDQIREYRRDNPKCVCCGSEDYKNLEVDHVTPFRELTIEWMMDNGLPIIETFGLDRVMKDRMKAESWKSFHLEKSKLQTLCKSCHKKKMRKL